MTVDLSEAQIEGFDRDYADEQLRRSQHPMRRLIKSFYLRRVLADVRGPTIDYGCGAGQLLRRLPSGSVGLEVNPHLIAALRATGLDVRPWQTNDDAWDLSGLEHAGYRTLVISHVLEHLPDPTQALARLLRGCRRIGVERLIAVVPGALGFARDSTHLTFIDDAYVEKNGWERLADSRLKRQRFFPLPWEGGGRIYLYNEMQLVFDLNELTPS